MFFFFFSSRRRHTRLTCDWSSDVCSSDLRELRDLTRYRKVLIQQRVTEANRVRKLLESANIKLGVVATDVLGASGRAMLRALQSGERDGAVLAELAQGTLRQKR